MKYVNSKVILNQTALNEITRAATQALEMTGDYVLSEVVEAQVVPFGDSFEYGGKTHQGGTLQDSGYVYKKQSHNGNVQIVFNTPYARRLYFHPEYNFRKIDNPNARGKWLEDWAQKGKYAKEVQNAYKFFFKQLGGF